MRNKEIENLANKLSKDVLKHITGGEDTFIMNDPFNPLNSGTLNSGTLGIECTGSSYHCGPIGVYVYCGPADPHSCTGDFKCNAHCALPVHKAPSI